MTRKEFLKMCAVFGIGLPLQTSLSSCGKEGEVTPQTSKVIIIGAGAAGLAAGYLLNQQGIDFEILEASARYGGRMKRTTDFANFPLPLGAEWLHVEREVLDEIVNDSSVQVAVQTTPYDPNVDFGLFNGVQVSVADVGFTIDQKFINASWFDFFEQYIVPSVQSKIRFNTVIDSIDYSGDQVTLSSANANFIADRVISTIPVKILQNGAVSFTPPLPDYKMTAINEVTVWDGCKAFIEFSEKFYPAFTAFETIPESAGQKLYYDAAYGQNTTQNIMGLFAVGVEAQVYNQLPENELLDFMLNELDAIYDNRASATYVKHIFQNWNAEPFANGAYIYDQEDWQRLRTLGRSVDNKLYFAGDAYTTGDDWSSVHAAARSALRAVEELVG
ncbi:MAG: FAD-dependent oxidoreductase [Bacteroidota bacterium]